VDCGWLVRSPRPVSADITDDQRRSGDGRQLDEMWTLSTSRPQKRINVPTDPDDNRVLECAGSQTRSLDDDVLGTNPKYDVAAGESVTRERMLAWIEEADADKGENARARLTAAAG
jgi:hypothetical protein